MTGLDKYAAALKAQKRVLVCYDSETDVVTRYKKNGLLPLVTTHRGTLQNTGHNWAEAVSLFVTRPPEELAL